MQMGGQGVCPSLQTRSSMLASIGPSVPRGPLSILLHDYFTLLHNSPWKPAESQHDRHPELLELHAKGLIGLVTPFSRASLAWKNVCSHSRTAPLVDGCMLYLAILHACQEEPSAALPHHPQHMNHVMMPSLPLAKYLTTSLVSIIAGGIGLRINNIWCAGWNICLTYLYLAAALHVSNPRVCNLSGCMAHFEHFAVTTFTVWHHMCRCACDAARDCRQRLCRRNAR